MLNIDQFFLENRYSPNTEERYRRAICALAMDHPDLGALTAAAFRQWLDSHNWASSTRWVTYTGIKRYLTWQYGPDHSALKLKIRRIDNPPQRTLTANEAARLLDSFDDSPKGIRDRAIAAMLLDTGLRASELCGLELKQVHLAERTLAALCKGGQWGYGTFSSKTAEFIRAWLPERNELSEDITLFVSVGGSTPGRRLTRCGLRVIIRYWGEALGMPISPHDFRRTMATLATLNGAPAKVVQVAGRWNDIRMVARYTRAIEVKDFGRYFPVDHLAI